LYAGVQVNFWMAERHCNQLKHFLDATFDTAKISKAGSWGSVVF
jgi:hypothetical protein